MNVLYDVAVLGLGHRWEKARTGVFRVVDNVARELARNPEVDLHFCATREPVACGQHLRSDPALAGVPFLPAPARLALDYAEGLVGAAPAGLPRWDPRRVARGLVMRAVVRTRRALPVVESRRLAAAALFHSPFHALPAVTRGRPGLRRILTVYDLIAIAHPELFEAGVEQLVKEAIGSVTPDDWVLCISEATRRDLLDYRSDLHPDRVRVTPLAAADHFCPDRREQAWPAVAAKYGIPDAPYALTLSTLEPRKNIPHVLRCYARLVREGQVDDLRLVMVGAHGWKMESTFAELKALGDARSRVTVTGFVPDRDLSAVYSHASMFIYPSLHEGFGLPPLEAMKCGVPVITSNTSSLPEVVGDAGLMVAPTDGDALCDAIIRLHRDETLRRDLGARACKRAGEFSWVRCGAETIATYRAALSQSH
jgi:glycosyltransferase involved in cell wall biosynthesis